MIEKLIFNVLALGLFTITFLKLIRKNDTSYLYVLGLQFIGIALNFLELFLGISLHYTLKIFIWILSIVIPVILLWVEIKKNMDFPELFNITVTKILQNFGKEEKAKTNIINFLNKNQNSYIAHKILAEIYEKEENYEASVSEYLKVTELKKNDLFSAYKLSAVLNKNKQNEESIIVLQEILKQRPEYEQATNLLGEIFFEEERYKEAISIYMSALKYHPGSYDLYYNLGMAYTMINDFKRAKEFYEKAAAINTLAYNAKLNLGQIALIYGDLELAEKYFMEATKQEDLEAGSYYYLSQIALLKGDKDRAIDYMNVAIQLDYNIYKQVLRDPIFKQIQNKINKPKEKKYQKRTNSLTKKEKCVNKHLMKTCILVKKLSNEDIQISKKIKKYENIEKEK